MDKFCIIAHSMQQRYRLAARHLPNEKNPGIEVIAQPGEGIDNALAVGMNGVFVVSNHAMYGFRRSVDGTPEIIWREAYDRGSAPKPGTMGHGSGSTPTLLGDDYVAITDNADGRVNALVYRQQQELGDMPRLVCQQAIFPSDRGTTENSLSAVGLSLIAENNFGYQGPYENITAEPGLARIDIDADGRSCTLAWYFTAVDFNTGKLVYKVLTGIGAGFNHHYGSMSLAQDGTMYIGVLLGVVSVRDGGGAAKP